MIPEYLISPAAALALRSSYERRMWADVAQPALNDYLREVRKVALGSPNSFTEGRCFLLWEEIVGSAIVEAGLGEELDRLLEVEVPSLVYAGARRGMEAGAELSDADLYRLLTSILFIPPESLTAAGWKDVLASLGDRISRTGSLIRAAMERFTRTATTRKFAADSVKEMERLEINQVRWVARMDDVTRDSHREANGQTLPRGTPFTVGGELLRYPGDPQGSPAQTYNCRCYLVGVLTTR